MQAIEQILTAKAIAAVRELYGKDCSGEQIQLQKTRKEFEADITIVVFPLLKLSGKSPENTAAEIGNHLKHNCDEVTGYSVVKGFLNLNIIDSYYLNFLNKAFNNENFGFVNATSESEKIMVEYSSPNTNKPLH